MFDSPVGLGCVSLLQSSDKGQIVRVPLKATAEDLRVHTQLLWEVCRPGPKRIITNNN